MITVFAESARHNPILYLCKKMPSSMKRDLNFFRLSNLSHSSQGIAPTFDFPYNFSFAAPSFSKNPSKLSSFK